MFDRIIRSSLRNPWLVLVTALLISGFGLWASMTTPLDVLPELTAPTVTVVTDAEGMAPDEVEQRVTVPLEQALYGATGVRRVRSTSATGLSLVWVEFEWDVDPFVARQVVSERLAITRGTLPSGLEPVLAPASSVMGEVVFVGVQGDASVSPMDLRDAAEWTVRRRLLSVPGVAQVVGLGGDVKQVQVELLPDKLLHHEVGAHQVLEALEGVSDSAVGGFQTSGAQEYLIRGVGRVASLEALRQTVVAHRHGAPILVGHVAEVSFAPAIKRGDAAIDGEPAVVLKITKQPHENTLALTDRIDDALDEIEGQLPEGISLYRKGFRQADFIHVALDNVKLVLRDAAILVVVVLIMFLVSWRTTVISLVALPLSLLIAILVLRSTGATLNTMTLGGLAIAIGELVDDAIIDVENVVRRLRENAAKPVEERLGIARVIYRASSEVRSAIVFATAIIVFAFMPLFFLEGVEGRLLRPLGVAYVTSIVASLLVALTVTPVLCWLLLRSSESMKGHEGWLARKLKHAYRPIVTYTLRRPKTLGGVSLLLVAGAVALSMTFGRSFLPEFNEGSLNITAATAPGTSLETSDRIVSRLDKFLVENEAVTSVVRVTGRAERDEHALEVNYSELEVGLDLSKADRVEAFSEVREVSKNIPGLTVTVGQPISHRIDHMLSGARASIVVKLFGDELDQLRTLGQQTENVLRTVPGLVDVALEQQTDIPQITVRPKPAELSSFGMSPGKLAHLTEMAFYGETVGTWWEGERVYDIVARFPERYREDFTLMRTTPIDADGLRYAQLGSVADVQKTMGPNLVNRENVQRRILVTANVSGRDVGGAAEEALERVRSEVKLPPGYRVVLGGSFENEAAARKRLLLLGGTSIVAIAGILWFAFRSWRDASLVLLNLPLALVGGVVAVYLSGGIMTIASLVGFVTLFGIAVRNGIMLVSHYRHLAEEQGRDLDDLVIQGSVDRLLPILMTALTAALALIPLSLATGEPGNEILSPMANVILGGLISATALNLVVVPGLYRRFGKPRSEDEAGPMSVAGVASYPPPKRS